MTLPAPFFRDHADRHGLDEPSGRGALVIVDLDADAVRALYVDARQHALGPYRYGLRRSATATWTRLLEDPRTREVICRDLLTPTWEVRP